ncbi:MAG: iron-sulfur cluster repair di-iron protein [Alphaproteobacteria bacterium]
MTITPTTLIGSLAISNLKIAEVFEKHRIDFCCKGNRSLEQACTSMNIEITPLIEELNTIKANENKDSDELLNLSEMPLDTLLDHIIDTHHLYIKETLPTLTRHMDKVLEVHGNAYAYLTEFSNTFYALKEEIEVHLEKEEQILFPYIRSLAIASRTEEKSSLPDSCFGTVSNPIGMMEMEHDNAGEALARLRSLSDDYMLEDTACNTHRALFKGIQDFERDLHLHIAKENSLLHPQAIALEKTFNG